MYFYDLQWARHWAGCLLLVPFLDWAGGPGTVVMAGAFFALAGALWHSLDPASGRRVKISVGVAAVLVLVVIGNRESHIIDVKYAKGARIQGEEYSQWNSFSRISVGPASDTGKPLILIDSDAGTEIAQCDPATMSAEERKRLLSIGPGLPYAVRPGGKTLVIGAGGGPDVCRALVTGSSDITAVEINPIIARDVMMERYAWSPAAATSPPSRSTLIIARDWSAPQRVSICAPSSRSRTGAATSAVSTSRSM